jgi:hypothetical protein
VKLVPVILILIALSSNAKINSRKIERETKREKQEIESGKEKSKVMHCFERNDI